MQTHMHARIPLHKLKFFAMFSLLLLGLSSQLWSQDLPYLLVEYMKVKPGMNAKYLDVEAKHWKPIHQERVKDGSILDWALYQIAYPSGTQSEYDYVTVTVFANYEKLESSITLDHFKAAHPTGDPQEMMAQTNETRDLVNRLMVQTLDFLPASENSPPAKYAQVDYMKVPEGGEEAYQEIETSIWKKIHKARQKAGKIEGWGMYSIRYPYGSDQPYNFTTANFMSSWKQTGMGIEMEDAKAAGLSEDSAEVMKKTLSSRSLVNSELWERVDGLN